MSLFDGDLGFETINPGYNRTFQLGRLSLGLVVTLMNRHMERVELAEALGLSAVWLRDVPFNAYHLLNYLKSLQQIGIHHVVLNLRFNQRDIETTLKDLSAEILPEFQQ